MWVVNAPQQAYRGGQCPPHQRFSDSEGVGRLGEGRVNLWVRAAESLWCGNKFAWVRLWVVARTGGVWPDMAENTEGKRKFALWIRESSLEQVRKWYKADDCSSQSEFIEKAIHFYIGYISSENGSDYLPKIITSTVKGIVNDSDNRISRILFKLAVEQAITMNVVAATCNIGREQLEKLRGTCVAQVKRSNGVYSFEDAFDFQKR